MLCPVCENESESTQQCTNCGWQFVYFTQEPSEEEQKEYVLLLQNYKEQHSKQDKIIKLTPEILEKDMFETRDEYKARIKNLKNVIIGKVFLIDYDINTEIFNIKCEVFNSVKNQLDGSVVEDFVEKVKISRDEAKIMYNKSREYHLNTTIDVLNNRITIVDISMAGYNFFYELEMLDEEQRLNSLVWIDQNNHLMWYKKLHPCSWEDSRTYAEDINSKKIACFIGWRLPTIQELKLFVAAKFQTELSNWSVDNQHLKGSYVNGDGSAFIRGSKEEVHNTILVRDMRKN